MQKECYPAYPQLDEKKFYDEIYHDARYHFGGASCVAMREGAGFHLMEQQHQLRRFYTPVTGSRGGLWFQNTGCGKTGTAILCSLQYNIFQTFRPTLFLIPNEHVYNEVQYEIFGREWTTQANGDLRSYFVRKFTGDAFVTPELRNVLNSMDSERAKDSVCKKIWEEHVSKYFELETHKRFDATILGNTIGTKYTPAKTAEEIRMKYSNRIIIVDEAQNIRKEKRLYRALMEILKYAENVTLYLLTATPMIESAEEICPLINLLLRNEGVAENKFLTPEIIRRYVKDDDAEAGEHMKWCFRGRISYVRGLDPRSFPTRMDSGITLYDDLPRHHIVPCYMKGRQLMAYITTFMGEFKPNQEAGQHNNLWLGAREVCRCLVLPEMGEWQNGATAKFWTIRKSKMWLLKNMNDLSAKMVEAHRIINELHPVGPIMIYSSR